MWVYLNDAHLSIVAHREVADCLLVRARVRGDIEAVFPHAQVEHTPHGDYAFRAKVRREEVAEALAQRVEAIDYDNFKNSCPDSRHRAYLDVWAAGAEALQRLDADLGPR
ncbi:MAG TPA: hypothetical protein VM328_11535 [Fimbriimonadaceae bacterium]|nr:hypothetical protein [Fimbriimonadaceae bacterium]